MRKDFLFSAVATKSLKDGDLEKAKEYYQKIIEYNKKTKEIAGMDGEIRSAWAAREMKRLEESNK